MWNSDLPSVTSSGFIQVRTAERLLIIQAGGMVSKALLHLSLSKLRRHHGRRWRLSEKAPGLRSMLPDQHKSKAVSFHPLLV